MMVPTPSVHFTIRSDRNCAFIKAQNIKALLSEHLKGLLSDGFPSELIKKLKDLNLKQPSENISGDVGLRPTSEMSVHAL